MPNDPTGRPRADQPSSDDARDDQTLLDGALAGDSSALRSLMDRYDRLVRYAVFRTARRQCLRDPQWLDTVAHDTWLGLLRSLARDPSNRAQSLSAYVTTIARFQAISALRRDRTLELGDRIELSDEKASDRSGVQKSPDELLSDLASLEVMRNYLNGLSESDKIILSQLTAITDRRWIEAGKALGMTESTLRSRWKRILERLRDLLAGEDADSFAPGRKSSDQ